MLHPGLGSPLDPTSTWQVDTHEVGEAVSLYERQLSGLDDPEQMTRRLGKLWKKLGSAPGLARLVIDYALFLRQNAEITTKTPGRTGSRLFGRYFATLDRNPTRIETPATLADVEDDPLYDRWVDG